MDVKPGTRLWGLVCATEAAVIRPRGTPLVMKGARVLHGSD
jgi:hypothetical protein